MDIREAAAKYYDAQDFPNDLPFYQAIVGRSGPRLLELGCGTGRMLLPLSAICAFVQGIDISPSMIDICQRKIASAGIPESTATARVADIASFDLGTQYDLIIAPFRVLQNLESDVSANSSPPTPAVAQAAFLPPYAQQGGGRNEGHEQGKDGALAASV